MNLYINLLPAGQTPCPNPLPSISSSSPTTPRFALCLLLLPQNSNTPYTATPRRRFALFFFFPDTATPRRCSNALMQPYVFFPKPRRCSLSLSDYQTMICYLPPGTAPKMKIINSGNGGFLQPSLFLKAFERVTDSQVCFKSSRVFLKFSQVSQVFFCRGISDFSEKSRLVVGLFAENLLNFFPRVDRVNSEYQSTHSSPTNSGRVQVSGIGLVAVASRRIQLSRVVPDSADFLNAESNESNLLVHRSMQQHQSLNRFDSLNPIFPQL